MKKIITIAIATLVVSFAAQSEVITKGGAAGLVKSPAIRTEAPVAKAMGCAMCKSEFAKVQTLTFKGTAPAAVTVERHECPSCGTKWVSTGHGKAKVESAVHTCGSCKS
jgi:hypothetical protein